jgi:hypothetical protein
MRIHVRAVNLSIDGEARARVERRLETGLSRLAHRILRVGVRTLERTRDLRRKGPASRQSTDPLFS